MVEGEADHMAYARGYTNKIVFRHATLTSSYDVKLFIYPVPTAETREISTRKMSYLNNDDERAAEQYSDRIVNFIVRFFAGLSSERFCVWFDMKGLDPKDKVEICFMVGETKSGLLNGDRITKTLAVMLNAMAANLYGWQKFVRISIQQFDCGVNYFYGRFLMRYFAVKRRIYNNSYFESITVLLIVWSTITNVIARWQGSAKLIPGETELFSALLSGQYKFPPINLIVHNRRVIYEATEIDYVAAVHECADATEAAMMKYIETFFQDVVNSVSRHDLRFRLYQNMASVKFIFGLQTNAEQTIGYDKNVYKSFEGEIDANSRSFGTSVYRSMRGRAAKFEQRVKKYADGVVQSIGRVPMRWIKPKSYVLTEENFSEMPKFINVLKFSAVNEIVDSEKFARSASWDFSSGLYDVVVRAVVL